MHYEKRIPDKNFVERFTTFFYRSSDNKILPLTVFGELGFIEIKEIGHHVIHTYGDLVTIYFHRDNDPRTLDLEMLADSYQESNLFQYSKKYTDLFHPIELKCKDQIIEFVKLHNNFSAGVFFDISESIKNILDDELGEKGLSKSTTPVIFNKYKPDLCSHVDAHAVSEKINNTLDTQKTKLCHTSFVVPISGCENTEMYWQTGDYDFLNVTFYTSANPTPIPNYIFIKWYSEPKKVSSAYITDKVTICATDIPHGIILVPGPEKIRTTISFRLLNNETFSEIKEKFINSQ